MPETLWTTTADYGYPDMSTVDDATWLDFFTQARITHREELDHIATQQAAPTVENTLHPYALAGAQLAAAMRAFDCVYSANATPARQQVYTELAPVRAAHQDWVTLHPGCNARFKALQERIRQGHIEATAEQQRFLDNILTQAEVSGAGLSGEAREELLSLNEQIASEESVYQQLQIRELAERALYVETAAELNGVSEAEIASASAAAQQAGYQHGYLLRLTMPVQQQALRHLKDRKTRRRLYEASTGRGLLRGADGRSTYDIAATIAQLRAQKAQLLGYENYLESILPLRTAPSREAIEQFLGQLADGARTRLDTEIQSISQTLDLGEDHDEGLAPWDIFFGYAQTAPLTEDSGNTSQPLEEMLARLFDAAWRVYRITIVERPDLPAFVPGARSFEVFSGPATAPGTGLGLFLLDLYTREGKGGGAWMNSFSVASSLAGTHPVVINCLNLAPAAEGQEVCLTDREQRTLFHEFGHALHGLLAEVEFPQLSGTAVPRDNVEFPSQVNEVFQELYISDAPSSGDTPDELALWGKGHSTYEHLAAVVIDVAWHTLCPEEAEQAAADPQAFEAEVLQRWGLDSALVPPRYSSGFFKHVFASSGYAAGYYSYLWAEVMAADASQWYREVLDDDVALAQRGRHFGAELLSRGNTRDPYESFCAALGREPQLEPLLRSLGLTGEPAAVSDPTCSD